MLEQDEPFVTKGSNSVAGSKDCASPEFGQSKYWVDGEQEQITVQAGQLEQQVQRMRFFFFF